MRPFIEEVVEDGAFPETDEGAADADVVVDEGMDERTEGETDGDGGEAVHAEERHAFVVHLESRGRCNATWLFQALCWCGEIERKGA